MVSITIDRKFTTNYHHIADRAQKMREKQKIIYHLFTKTL